MQNLITGTNGFLGKFILANSPESFTIGRHDLASLTHDLRSPFKKSLGKFNQVIHCAGKAHSTPKNTREIKEFYEVNLEGTLNLLRALSDSPPNQFIFISTVAVYGKETGTLISEDHPLDGNTPYAKSKVLAESEILNWGLKNNVKILILRLPLIAGPNPPGNLGKMIKGIRSGRYLSIAGGSARRSAVLAKDVANFVIENPNADGIFNLTDGYHPTFREIEQVITAQLSGKKIKSINGFFANLFGKLGDWVPKSPVNSHTISKMTSDLTFDDKKARQQIGWSSRRIIDEFRIK